MSATDRVRVQIADHVADVALTRADKHNGLDHAMFEAIGEAIDEVGSTQGVRAVVLHGEGPSFCAGLDFASFMSEGRDPAAMFFRRDGEDCNFAQRPAYGWQALDIPVIAAVHGNCIGGGAQIALAADIRIAAPDTRLSIREIAYGLIPDMGMTQSLPRLVPIDVAKELVWSGRMVDADEAVQIGLVTRLADDPVGAARELAASIATSSPDAIQRGKRLIEAAYAPDPAESLAFEEALQSELLGSPNQVAAVTAAMTKEPASFEDAAPDSA